MHLKWLFQPSHVITWALEIFALHDSIVQKTLAQEHPEKNGISQIKCGHWSKLLNKIDECVGHLMYGQANNMTENATISNNLNHVIYCDASIYRALCLLMAIACASATFFLSFAQIRISHVHSFHMQHCLRRGFSNMIFFSVLELLFLFN